MPSRVRSVTLRIRARQGEENTPLRCGKERLSPDAEDAVLESLLGNPPENPGKEDPYTSELMTAAVAEETEDGRLCLRYRESELSGMEGTTTEISFSRAEPTLVTIERTGSVRCVLVLEPGRYHTGTYETPVMPLTVTVHALRLENSATLEGGRLETEYLLRIGGITSTRTRLSVEVLARGGNT